MPSPYLPQDSFATHPQAYTMPLRPKKKERDHEADAETEEFVYGIHNGRWITSANWQPPKGFKGPLIPYEANDPLKPLEPRSLPDNLEDYVSILCVNIRYVTPESPGIKLELYPHEDKFPRRSMAWIQGVMDWRVRIFAGEQMEPATTPFKSTKYRTHGRDDPESWVPESQLMGFELEERMELIRRRRESDDETRADKGTTGA
ncbi:hypothetical protein P154DRAFT_532000 [Amniculicola lignicola CBS 123094]|uniref:Uncharacterized protein n=1 Tax=Amniculicola lignicola CBS 123094 TaxID=1392246 RepID=A0A6A5WRB7_9PLEO|nr:hypothetical protein P154DRAFT_532000 [Amniculicola lignicola CBS 123094]